MSSATKALTLLSHFSADCPEIGLSHMCRVAGRDKATTYRHLQALEATGFVEQNPLTKQYRLGPAVLHLAHLREVTVPRKDAALAAASTLAEATGETAHVSVLSGTTVYALCDCLSPRHGTRAVIDITTFPLHATASGLCAMAFGHDALMETALENLTGFTSATPQSKSDLQTLIASIRATGFACADQSYESEIQGIAAPLFDQTGRYAGAVAVACVASRFTRALEQTITSELIIAARAITRSWGGTIPTPIEAAWATLDTNPQELDTTS